ncbi:hypothetical protein, partial [Thioclava sp.]|uniref:hypothetical protein n=1 Tax=Thioclava sp. TaxID=1933450 RepID=UPI00324283C8
TKISFLDMSHQAGGNPRADTPRNSNSFYNWLNSKRFQEVNAYEELYGNRSEIRSTQQEYEELLTKVALISED